jgi:hypothetical protein
MMMMVVMMTMMMMMDSPLSSLEAVLWQGAASQGLDADLVLALEGCLTVDGQSNCQDQHQASAGQAASNLSSAWDVAQGAQLHVQTQATSNERLLQMCLHSWSLLPSQLPGFH